MNELVIRFSGYPDKMEILIMGPRDYTSYLNTEERKESLALLRSLADEVEFGADDYVVKPFSAKELVARVRAALRHTKPQDGHPEPWFC